MKRKIWSISDDELHLRLFDPDEVVTDEKSPIVVAEITREGILYMTGLLADLQRGSDEAFLKWLHWSEIDIPEEYAQ